MDDTVGYIVSGGVFLITPPPEYDWSQEGVSLINIDTNGSLILSTENDPPYSFGRGLKAELKPTIALELPDYSYRINLSLSPHGAIGWGYAYQLNFNWNGMYYRRGAESWDPWMKLLMENSNKHVGIGGYPDCNLDIRDTAPNTTKTKLARLSEGTHTYRGWQYAISSRSYS